MELMSVESSSEFPQNSADKSPVQMNTFSLTSLFSRVYGQQIFLDNFSLTSFVAGVHWVL
jgi:hypothetical protein